MHNSNNKQTNAELLILYTEQYENFHRHFWSIYYKFVYAIIFVLSIYLFKWNEFPYNANKWNSFFVFIFCIIEIFISTTSTVILSREYTNLKRKEEIRNFYADKMKVPLVCNKDNKKNYPCKIIAKEITIGNILRFSLLAFGILAIVIIITTYTYSPTLVNGEQSNLLPASTCTCISNACTNSTN